MVIAVIDGQGAGLGQTVIKRIRKELSNNVLIIALGTNDTAAQNMLRAGANKAYSGEKELCNFCRSHAVDALVGPIGIICSGGIMGEITTPIGQAVFEMDCVKYLIPLKKHGIYIPGTRNMEIREFLEEIVAELKEQYKIIIKK